MRFDIVIPKGIEEKYYHIIEIENCN